MHAAGLTGPLAAAPPEEDLKWQCGWCRSRLLSAAIRDTGDVWVANIFPKDRPEIMREIGTAQKEVKDGESRKNLAAFGAAVAAAK